MTLLEFFLHFFWHKHFRKKRHSNNFPRSTLFKKIVADNHMSTVLPLATFVNMHLTCLAVVVYMKVRFKSKVSEVFLSLKATIYQDWKICFVDIYRIFKHGKSCLENINNKACNKWMTINKIPRFLNPWHFNLNPWHVILEPGFLTKTHTSICHATWTCIMFFVHFLCLFW